MDKLRESLGYSKNFSKSKKNRIAMKRADQLYEIIEIEKECKLTKNEFIVRLNNYLIECNLIELKNFESMFVGRKVQDILNISQADLLKRDNMIIEQTNNKKLLANVFGCSDERLNGEYRLIGLMNGSPVFQNDSKIYIMRIYSSADNGTYFWMFKKISTYKKVKYELGNDRSWYYIARETLMTGYPPINGYIYKNPHEKNRTRKTKSEISTNTAC